MSEQNSTYYLIDGSIYIFQSHFSPHVECFDVDGNDLSAVYGFTQFLLQFLRRVKPDRIAVALDESLFSGFRHDLCPNYKSNRELPDENLAMQLKGCREICSILGMASYASKKYEADDIIGTLSVRMSELLPGDPALCIVTRDKDLSQLLRTDKDYMWDYSGNRKRYRADIKEEFGVSPEQFADYLGLVGDSVDCITGVPGVGPVKAKELLRNFASLDGIYENLDAVAGLSLRGAAGLASKLESHQAEARLSRELATIICNASDRHEGFAHALPSSLEVTDIDVPSFEKFLSNYKFTKNDGAHLLSVAERFSSQ
ncbi:MAG: flap endonuclease [SAR86 cluster bacterium]|uniref:Flap endonuclease n=1 Tax=SAR86 cluster bacterium TaxID=2030880 RepID=A0A2A4WVC1_9GAMM|nr:MAG: flap endonuclease [SAR86 cluster bacterium]